jgi:hypothetical protein
MAIMWAILGFVLAGLLAMGWLGPLSALGKGFGKFAGLFAAALLIGLGLGTIGSDFLLNLLQTWPSIYAFLVAFLGGTTIAGLLGL